MPLRPWTRDRDDPQYEISRDAWERLMDARDARGRRFKVHKLEQPRPMRMTAEESAGIDAADSSKAREAGARLAASYVNFYIGTRRVVVPLLDSKRDGKALRQLQELFPKREVVQIPALELAYGGGGIHAFTLPQPVGSIVKP